MGQLNLPKTGTKASPAGTIGLGANSLGQFEGTDEHGNKTVLGGGSPINILANKGLGLAADLPTTYVANDVYVTIDTFKIYVASSISSWSNEDLTDSQFITDTSETTYTLYQYDNSTITIIGLSGSNKYPKEFINSDLTNKILPITHGLGVQFPVELTVYNGNNKLVSPSKYDYEGLSINTGNLTIYEENISGIWRIILTGATDLKTYPLEFINSDLTNKVLSLTHSLGAQYPSGVIVYNGNNKLVSPDKYDYEGLTTSTGELTIYEENISDTWRIILIK